MEASLASDCRVRLVLPRSTKPSTTSGFSHLSGCLSTPEAELRRVCAFAELAFDPAMLRYHEGAGERLGEIGDRYGRDGRLRSARGQRLAALESTTRPPDPGLSGRWRRDMDETDQAEFERVAGDLLRELGYAP